MNRRMIGELLYSCVNVKAGLHRSEFVVLMVLYACDCEGYMIVHFYRLWDEEEDV